VESRTVHLVGHTDPRGTEEYNLALSDQRAQAVRRYLENLGVPSGRLVVVPKGELEAQGTDEQTWAEDRRVELIWF
jgi:peptidoglycan-associated lipoprotein